MRLPIIGPAYDTDIASYNQQKCINWFPEINHVAAGFNPQFNQPYILRPTPGMVSFCTLGSDNSVRALETHRGVLYAVGDNNLYSVNSSGVETLLGTLNPTPVTDDSLARIIPGTTSLMIVDRDLAFAYNITGGTLTQIVDPDFPSAIEDGTYLDGFYVVIEKDTHKFYISAAEDPTSWNALDFASATSEGDYLKACAADHRELWLFGSHTTEVWYNSGNADFTFERRPGIILQHGIAAKHSIVQSANTVYWLAKDRSGQNIVVRAQGYVPQSIMTPAIAHQINQYTTVDDAIAYTHRVGSHEFYVLTFPTEDKTWVYDVSNNQWHERQSFDGTDYGRHRGNCAMFEYNKSLVGDYRTNNIFQYSETTYDENGDTLKRIRQGPPLYIENQLVSMYDVQLDFESGVGLQSGQGSDPQVMLRVSKDGGHTWGNVLTRSIGATGVYNTRVKWDSLGQGRDWVFEITVTDPVKAVLLGATAEVD